MVLIFTHCYINVFLDVGGTRVPLYYNLCCAIQDHLDQITAWSYKYEIQHFPSHGR